MSLREPRRAASSAVWVWRTAFSASTARRPCMVRPSGGDVRVLAAQVQYPRRLRMLATLRRLPRRRDVLRRLHAEPLLRHLRAQLLLRARRGGEGRCRRGERARAPAPGRGIHYCCLACFLPRTALSCKNKTEQNMPNGGRSASC
ncbi:hypothetical protein BAE44_0025582 [Dichanthelium oligosanthes]|uniref:Uncharacterized protein n=1 Tax=Dichanthelium oligosanthes TaxID=888268 RepID=A0A1E5UKJ7_9POAL|nr:hypothetical protein BAE44_0025582 [Dichanthelium oligosanthes]